MKTSVDSDILLFGGVDQLYSFSGYYHAKIDDIRIYARVLNMQEIQALFDNATGLELEYDISSLKIYPNPSNTLLNISSKGQGLIESIRITDMIGRTVHFESGLESTDQYQIDIHDFAEGTYFLSINEENRALKFVIE